MVRPGWLAARISHQARAPPVSRSSAPDPPPACRSTTPQHGGRQDRTAQPHDADASRTLQRPGRPASDREVILCAPSAKPTGAGAHRRFEVGPRRGRAGRVPPREHRPGLPPRSADGARRRAPPDGRTGTIAARTSPGGWLGRGQRSQRGAARRERSADAMPPSARALSWPR